MKNNRFWLILLASILCFGGLVSAQDTDSSMILLMNGDLWAWSGDVDHQPIQYTACQPPEGISSMPVVSPDGRNMAFATMPVIVREALEREGGIGGGALPSNVWLCGSGMGGQELTLVGPQPTDASFFTANVPDRATAQSEPVWSPDGRKLAWTELRFHEGGDWLTIYEVATGKRISVKTEAVQQYGVPVPLPIVWGELGIMLLSFAPVPGSTDPHQTILVYDAVGNFLIETPLNPPENRSARELIPITDGDREYLGILYRHVGWVLFDPFTGESVALDYGAPELYNRFNPDGLSLLLMVDADFEYGWWVATPDGVYVSDTGQTRLFVEDNLTRITPSPVDSVAIASDLVFVWQDGETTPVAMTDAFYDSYFAGFVWGSTAWRVYHQTDTLNPTAITCPDFVVSRLVIGEKGTVIPGLGGGNKSRANPSVDAAQIGTIPENRPFTVLDGPVCAEGYAWWQVDFEGLVGWTVEGEGSTYWLQPAP